MVMGSVPDDIDCALSDTFNQKEPPGRSARSGQGARGPGGQVAPARLPRRLGLAGRPGSAGGVPPKAAPGRKWERGAVFNPWQARISLGSGFDV